MATFIGEYSARIDDRGRLVFPAPFKACISENATGKLVVKKSIYDKCLEIYTYEEWEEQSTKLKNSLNFFNPKHVQFYREFMRDRDVVQPDPKFGRIAIAKSLLDSIGADKSVVFFGTDFKIELWAKEKFEESRISHEEYVSIAESLSK